MPPCSAPCCWTPSILSSLAATPSWQRSPWRCRACSAAAASWRRRGPWTAMTQRPRRRPATTTAILPRRTTPWTCCPRRQGLSCWSSSPSSNLGRVSWSPKQAEAAGAAGSLLLTMILRRRFTWARHRRARTTEAASPAGATATRRTEVPWWRTQRCKSGTTRACAIPRSTSPSRGTSTRRHLRNRRVRRGTTRGGPRRRSRGSPTLPPSRRARAC
mmetsp:Transcript_56973/g.149236  ORF Transcript_56973/g.149236 Transcript_56973/m.149236 type:complete len:216 (+) Transcript_56973:1379-2026(+)